MTTRPCDFFGGSAKSVLNKPLLHVRDVKTLGTNGDAVGAHQTVDDLTLNTVLTNEIPGASLSADQITLPAGDYYIEADVPLYVNGNGFVYVRPLLRDAANNTLLVGIKGGSRGDNTLHRSNTHNPLSGRLTLTATTAIKMSAGVQLQTATGTYGSAGIDGSNAEEQYTDVRIWKLDSNVETPVISDPTMVLARPLFHAQDQKPDGTSGDITSQAIDTDLTINTVLTNEIAGASLSGNIITLPAGTYYVEARMPAYKGTANRVRYRMSLKDSFIGAVLLSGTSAVVGSDAAGAGATSESFVSGNITLADTTQIKLSVYSHDAGITVGLATPDGNIEVYTDIRIWQLDSLVRQPVLVNDKLYPLPGNVIVTGNMHGLEYEYNTVDTFTVQAGICMDSLNETVLTLTNPQLVDLNNATQNPQGLTPDTIYNIFLTDDGQLVKVDTDVNGANLPVNDKRRWIGFVLTNDIGDVILFLMQGNRMSFSNVVVGETSNAGAKRSVANFVPVSRVSSYGIRCLVTVSSQYFYVFNLFANDATGSSIYQNYQNIREARIAEVTMNSDGTYQTSDTVLSPRDISLMFAKLKR